MNPEIKEKWLKALRSGKYQQGKNYLYIDGCYCCLGVLCDLVDPEGWVEGERPLHQHLKIYLHDDFDTLPSTKMLEKVDLSLYDAQKLSSFNDDGKKFDYIADYIQNNL